MDAQWGIWEGWYGDGISKLVTASEKRGVQSWAGKERQAGLARTQRRGSVPWKYLEVVKPTACVQTVGKKVCLEVLIPGPLKTHLANAC